MLTGYSSVVGRKHIQRHVHLDTGVRDVFAIYLVMGVSGLPLGTSQAAGPGKGQPGEG